MRLYDDLTSGSKPNRDMTKRELNASIKKLWEYYVDSIDLSDSKAYYGREQYMKKEYERLYGADREAQYLSLKSLKRMIRLNNALRVIHPRELYCLIKL